MFCGECGREREERANFCTGCGTPISVGFEASSQARLSATTLLSKLTGIPLNDAHDQLLSIKVGTNETLLRSYENVTIQRTFAGDAWRYYGWRSDRSLPKRPPRPVKYVASLMLVTNRRFIFFEGHGAEIRLLTTKKIWDRWFDSYENTLHIGRSGLYLPPFWILDPRLCDELDGQFKERHQRDIAPYEELRNSPSLRDRGEWWLRNFAADLKAGHAVVASGKGVGDASRFIEEWSWVRLAGTTAGESCLAIELLRVWPARAAKDDSRWCEGTAKIYVNGPRQLAELLDAVVSVREQHHALNSDWNQELAPWSPVPSRRSRLVALLVCIVLVGLIFYSAASFPALSGGLMMTPMIIVLLIILGIVGFVIFAYVIALTSKRRQLSTKTEPMAKGGCCTSCKSVLPEGDRFCTSCGAQRAAVGS